MCVQYFRLDGGAQRSFDSESMAVPPLWLSSNSKVALVDQTGQAEFAQNRSLLRTRLGQHVGISASAALAVQAEPAGLDQHEGIWLPAKAAARLFASPSRFACPEQSGSSVVRTSSSK